MIEHRVPGEPEPTGDPYSLRASRESRELHALAEFIALDAVEAPQEVEVPP